MTAIDTPEALLFSFIGALLLKLMQVIGDWVKNSTSKRRARVNEVAALKLKVRLLTESLHDHRNMMLRSGKWTRADLPPFISKE